MNDSLAVRAEILKLARLLGREPETLQYLDQLPAVELRRLRELATDVLFDRHAPALGRLAAASRVLPSGLIATLAQRTFGPMLAARVAGLLDPSRAAEVAEKLPPAFLADVASELDPRRATAVLARIPPHQVAEVAPELLRRKDYVTMGRFVGHLSEAALRVAIGLMDGEALVEVAVVLEDTDQLEHVVSLLTDRQLQDAVERARAAGLLEQLVPLSAALAPSRVAGAASST